MEALVIEIDEKDLTDKVGSVFFRVVRLLSRLTRKAYFLISFNMIY